MVDIRPERSGDRSGIRAVHLAAFPGDVEATLVEQLDRDGHAEISLVAVAYGQVLGHVLFSRMEVEGDGRKLLALGLAPVAVLPDRQGGGIGSALIDAGLREAFARRTDIVFVLGEPDYYRRFGFDRGTAQPFASPYAGPYLQARAAPGFQLPSRGFARYASAFEGLG